LTKEEKGKGRKLGITRDWVFGERGEKNEADFAGGGGKKYIRRMRLRSMDTNGKNHSVVNKTKIV